jgi:hypothetical protein
VVSCENDLSTHPCPPLFGKKRGKLKLLAGLPLFFILPGERLVHDNSSETPRNINKRARFPEISLRAAS